MTPAEIVNNEKDAPENVKVDDMHALLSFSRRSHNSTRRMTPQHKLSNH